MSNISPNLNINGIGITLAELANMFLQYRGTNRITDFNDTSIKSGLYQYTDQTQNIPSRIGEYGNAIILKTYEYR